MAAVGSSAFPGALDQFGQWVDAVDGAPHVGSVIEAADMNRWADAIRQCQAQLLFRTGPLADATIDPSSRVNLTFDPASGTLLLRKPLYFDGSGASTTETGHWEGIVVPTWSGSTASITVAFPLRYTHMPTPGAAHASVSNVALHRNNTNILSNWGAPTIETTLLSANTFAMKLTATAHTYTADDTNGALYLTFDWSVGVGT